MLTSAAAQYRVRGRAVRKPPAILPRRWRHFSIPSPFAKRGQASPITIYRWLAKAPSAGANIVLIHYAGPQRDPAEDDILAHLSESGILVLAASTDNHEPVYPAWSRTCSP